MQKFSIFFFFLTFRYCIILVNIYLFLLKADWKSNFFVCLSGSFFFQPIALRITQLSGCGCTYSSIHVIINSVIISLIFDLFCLKSARQSPSGHGSYQEKSFRSQKSIGLNFLDEEKKGERRIKNPNKLILKSLIFLLYCILWHLHENVRAGFWLLKNPSTWNLKQT